MFKPLKSVSVLLLLFAMPAAISYAASENGATSVSVTQQNGTCKGVVKDKAGEAVIGASVVVKGTTNGVITDLDGNFVLSNVPDGATIQISYVGYTPQEVKFTGKPLDITLQEDTQTLDEVVVTALGIKRQKRSLGYSTTTVGGKDFTEARTTNIGNALSGKIAGVSVSGNATGPGGSSRVVIRGNASLTGNNQPLYVIDGVPFDNTNIGSAGQWGGKDMGDGLSSINPDDIADIQVLKGAAASALYGYRGGNGAILITTKSGQKGKPVSVDNMEHGMLPRRAQRSGSGQSTLLTTRTDVPEIAAVYPIAEDHYMAAADVQKTYAASENLDALIVKAREDMERAAKSLDFLAAAKFRDRMYELQKLREETGNGSSRKTARHETL